jgi:heme-degrading monooxygenase HmoA
MIAHTPTPPYYAVIFTSLKAETDEGYESMSQQMIDLVATQPGFLGFESARNETGITVSYWQNIEAIHHWKQNAQHLLAQQYGKSKWYKAFKVRICKVERDYEGGKEAH